MNCTHGFPLSVECGYCKELNAVRVAMTDPVLTAEEQVERKCDWLVRELDELCALANNSETRDLIAKEALAIGQIQFRAGLILSFLAADKPRLTVVSNHG